MATKLPCPWPWTLACREKIKCHIRPEVNGGAKVRELAIRPAPTKRRQGDWPNFAHDKMALQVMSEIDAQEFLHFVHDIDLEFLKSDKG